jgi:hypothetical protein
VTRYKVYENPTNSTTYGTPGVPYEGAPEHSITPIVEGGEIEDIAEAIYNNRGLGCYMEGDIEETIEDPVYGNETIVRFSRPVYVPVYVEISIHALTNYTDDIPSLVSEAVEDYLNSLDIGQTLALSSVIGAALSVMDDLSRPTFSVYSTTIGETISPAGTSDIAVEYNEVIQGLEANITVTVV